MNLKTVLTFSLGFVLAVTLEIYEPTLYQSIKTETMKLINNLDSLTTNKNGRIDK